MSKMISIQSCEKCPHKHRIIQHCCLAGQHLDHYPTFPKWCPLPDEFPLEMMNVMTKRDEVPLT